MMMIVVSSSSPRLRGHLATSLPEVHAGVFVGDNPARTRRRIRKQVETLIGGGDALMIWKGPDRPGLRFPARRPQPPDAGRFRRAESGFILSARIAEGSAGRPQRPV